MAGARAPYRKTQSGARDAEAIGREGLPALVSPRGGGRRPNAEDLRYRPFIPLRRSPALGRGTPPHTELGTLKRLEVSLSSQSPPPQRRPGMVPYGRETRSSARFPARPSRAEAESLLPLPTHHVRPWDPDTHACPLGAAQPRTPDARASGAQRRVPRAAMDGAGAKCSVGRKGGARGRCHVTLQLCAPGHLELSSALAPREALSPSGD